VAASDRGRWRDRDEPGRGYGTDESEDDFDLPKRPLYPGKIRSSSLIGNPNPPRWYPILPGKRRVSMSLYAPAADARRTEADPPSRIKTGPAPVQARGALQDDAGLVQERAADGLAEPGGRLPHLDTIQAAFGRHDINSIEAHVGGAAAQVAGEIGAEAYATGDHVAFARTPDLHTAAHEAAHVVQQRSGVQLKGGVGQEGDAYERHADRVADAVVARRSAEAILDELAPVDAARSSAARAVQRRPASSAQPVNAALYLHLNGVDAKQTIGSHLRGVRWPEPDARLAWRDRAAFTDELLKWLDQLLTTFDPPTNLQKLAFPADPLAAIDELRPLVGVQKPSGDNRHAGGRVGSADWQPRIGVAIGQQLEASIIASLARLGPRWLDAAERIHDEVEGEGITVPYEALVTSHWMDRAVGRAMAVGGVFRVRPAARGEATADRDRGKARAGGENSGRSASPLRPVQLEWQGARSPELWNFVRAVRPADATVEEVAAQLFGASAREEYGEPASFLAYGITAVPPLFGIPPVWARNFPQANAHAPIKGQPDDTFGGQVAAVAQSKLADDVALAQASPPSGAAKAKSAPAQAAPDVQVLLHLLSDSEAQADHLARLVAPWGLSATVAIGLVWIRRKQNELAAADADTRARWAPILREQKDRLAHVGAGIVQVIRSAAELEVSHPRQAEGGPIRAVLHTYAHAAAVSHLADTSSELLARAARQQRELPLAALRAASTSLGASMAMLDASTSPGDPAARELGAAGFQAEQGMRALSSKLLASGKLSPDELEDSILSAHELALKARISALGAELAQLEAAARDARAGLPAEAAAAFSSDFRDLAPGCKWIRHELDWIAGRMDSQADGGVVAPDGPDGMPAEKRAGLMRAQRRARLDHAQRRYAAIAAKRDVAAFLRKGAELVEWQAFRTACVKVSALLGISIAGSMLGGAFGSVAGKALLRAGAPAILARTGAVATNLAVDSAVSSAAQSALFRDSFADAFLENALAGAGTMAMLKVIAESADAAHVLGQRADSIWQKLGRVVVREGAAITGCAIMGAALGFAARRIVTGKSDPPPETVKEWLLQGASIAVGRYVSRAIQARRPRLEHLARFDEASVRPLIEAEAALAQDANTLEHHPDTRGGLYILVRRARVLQMELELVATLMKEPARLRGAGLGRDASKLKRLAESELEGLRDPEAVMATFQLAGLEELVPGSLWKGTPDEIQNALDGARAMSAPVPATRDPATARWSVKIGDRSVEIQERDPLESVRQSEQLLDVINGGSESEIKKATGFNDAQATAIVTERNARLKANPGQPPFGKVVELEGVTGISKRQAEDIQARQKWAQIELDDSPAAALRTRFRKDFDALRAAPANKGKSDYAIMKEIVAKDTGRYCLQGKEVELDVLETHGAFSKVIGMAGLFDYGYLKPSAKGLLKTKKKINNGDEFAAAVRSDPTLFDRSMLDMNAPVSGQNDVAWWAPRGKSSAGTAAELVKVLSLDPRSYVGGMIRITVDPKTAHTAKFRKPTPYDGLLFGEWVRERTALPLGVTAGGTAEAVAPPVRLDQATKLEVFLEGGSLATSSGAATALNPKAGTTSTSAAPGAPPVAKDPK
jgi:hypothetical protein